MASILEQLDRDLSALLVSLAAYERSKHAERYEAVRWQVPVLEKHCRNLRRQLAGDAQHAQSASETHSMID